MTQLKVPVSLTTTGADPGDERLAPPSSQHGETAGPQAGPQAGAIGALQGAAGAPDEQGERNSINDGRRQLLAPPKQLLHPGAATKLPSIIARHTVRDMFDSPNTFWS
ncbi:MAG: hypothetical protein NTY87_12055 [Planctomycetia bacterium]|nr:hypothetical protein [Planctomycetia bacterium]RLT13439.1 MAG: hypothetical protein DWI25_07095 [Planctomycetota bacterium]